MFRSTCGERWLGRTRRTPAWRSTSAGRGEGSKDGSSDPDRVLSLWWSNDLDLDGGWGKSSDLLLHSVSNTRVHGGASGHDGVGIQVLSDVNIALHDGVVGGLMDTTGLH